jgi:excisionase family DNA binding protein
MAKSQYTPQKRFSQTQATSEPQQGAVTMLPVDVANELSNLKAMLSELLTIQRQARLDAQPTEWIDTETARSIVGVSKTKWQQMRDDNVIPFSQHGRKIMFKRSDVEEYLNSGFRSNDKTFEL